MLRPKFIQKLVGHRHVEYCDGWLRQIREKEDGISPNGVTLSICNCGRSDKSRISRFPASVPNSKVLTGIHTWFFTALSEVPNNRQFRRWRLFHLKRFLPRTGLCKTCRRSALECPNDWSTKRAICGSPDFCIASPAIAWDHFWRHKSRATLWSDFSPGPPALDWFAGCSQEFGAASYEANDVVTASMQQSEAPEIQIPAEGTAFEGQDGECIDLVKFSIKFGRIHGFSHANPIAYAA